MDSTVWGEWQDVGDGTMHRYIERITVGGVTYTSDGGAMVAPDGRRLENVGRGEIRPVGRDAYTAYSLDGVNVVERGCGQDVDAAEDCAEAIRAALAK